MLRFWHFIMMVLIFLVITLSPIWSVWLVMQCEAASTDKLIKVGSKYRSNYINAMVIDHQLKHKWKKVGLGVKYDKL